MIFNINSTRGHTGSLLVSTMEPHYYGQPWNLLLVMLIGRWPYYQDWHPILFHFKEELFWTEQGVNIYWSIVLNRKTITLEFQEEVILYVWLWDMYLIMYTTNVPKQSHVPSPRSPGNVTNEKIVITDYTKQNTCGIEQCLISQTHLEQLIRDRSFKLQTSKQ